MKIENHKLYSKKLYRTIELDIRLPHNFDKDTKYNIMYMHDGHNLFYLEKSSYNQIWDVDTTLSLLEKKSYEETIVVGISSSQIANGVIRLQEYSIFDSCNLLSHHSEIFEGNEELLDGDFIHAKGQLYEHELLELIMPYVESKFNVKSREMIGSSMGGLFSLTFALRHQHLIDKVYCVSNAFWFNIDQLLQLIGDVKNEKDLKIYLDVGTKEVEDVALNNLYLNDNRSVYTKLLEQEYSVVFKEIENGVHNETAWAARLADILTSI